MTGDLPCDERCGASWCRYNNCGLCQDNTTCEDQVKNDREGGMTYEETTNMFLVGKTIKKANVSGHVVVLEFDDGSKFDYSASDGGYSCWENIVPEKKEQLK